MSEFKYAFGEEVLVTFNATNIQQAKIVDRKINESGNVYQVDWFCKVVKNGVPFLVEFFKDVRNHPWVMEQQLTKEGECHGTSPMQENG